MDGVVLDLRRNGGGLLTKPCALTGLFIDQGPVVQVKRRRRAGSHHQDDPDKGIVYGGPLVVLVSRFSASASEILAGALAGLRPGPDRRRLAPPTARGRCRRSSTWASRLRTRTRAKLGALKLTIQQFYRLNGDSTQDRGVLSDVVLPSLTEYITSGEKEQEFALAFDKVNPVEHEELGLVPADLKAVLKERSAKRVKDSADFTKLAKDIEHLQGTQGEEEAAAQ